jgi:cytochrome c-type biogenesis protein
MNAPGLLAALGAGLLTFLSPCVLPLIPGYLSFISGYGLAEIRSGAGRLRVLASTALFAAGFTAVFVLLGLVFAGGSLLLGGLSRALTIGAGLVVVLLGLNLVFDFIKILDLEARFHAARRPRGLAGAFLIGVAFAAGWSPCVGPILASILLYAARQGDAGHSALLLGAYSIGLAIPFLLVGLFFDAARPVMDWFKRHARAVRMGSGLFLVALGATMALGRLGAVSSIAAQAGMGLSESLILRPGTVRAAATGAWLLLAAAIALAAIPRGGRFGSGRIAVVAVLAALAAAEALGLWSTPALLSRWLLFQGA